MDEGVTGCAEHLMVSCLTIGSLKPTHWPLWLLPSFAQGHSTVQERSHSFKRSRPLPADTVAVDVIHHLLAILMRPDKALCFASAHASW